MIARFHMYAKGFALCHIRTESQLVGSLVVSIATMTLYPCELDAGKMGAAFHELVEEVAIA